MSNPQHDISSENFPVDQCEHCRGRHVTKYFLKHGPGYLEWLNVCDCCGGWTRYAEASNDGDDPTWLLMEEETVFRMRIDGNPELSCSA